MQLDACLDGLADTTLQAEADVREYLLGVKTTMSGDRPLFPALREYLVRFTAAYGLPVDLTVPPELEEAGAALDGRAAAPAHRPGGAHKRA